MSSKYYVGHWDCPSCGRKGILATTRHCPGCGTPVGENTEYYLKDKSCEVSKESVPDKPDWKCDYCGSYNSSTTNVCSNCGSTVNSRNKNYFGDDCTGYNSDEIIDETDSYKGSNDRYEDDIYSGNSESYHDDSMSYGSSKSYDTDDDIFSEGFVIQDPKGTDNKGNIKSFLTNLWQNGALKIAAIIIAALAVVGTIVGICIPKERFLTVESLSWKRVVHVEEYKTVQENAWVLPADARLKYTRQEIHHYDTVQDGYKTEYYTEQEFDGYETRTRTVNLGNGRFRTDTEQIPKYKTVTKSRQVPNYKEEPVYRTKYYYDIDKYVFDHDNVAEMSDKSPYWPEMPEEPATPYIGAERVGSTEEHYWVYGLVEGKDVRKEFSISYPEWNSLEVNDYIKVKVYITGKITLIEEE